MTGSFREQYSLLREYAQELINQNLGTTVRIDVQQEPNPDSPTRTFIRVYVSLGYLKQGFRACGREILGLDGCFMSVAYAIVEAESKASWCWILNLLGKDLGIEANFNYTFIYDRQKGLIQAIAFVFPSAEQMYCVRHIHENMKSQFKGGVYKDMLWNAARATTVGELKKKNGRAKCDQLLNNICDVFSRQLVDDKDQPIITCLEYIREYLMKRIVVVQKVIAKTVGPLTPSVTALFDAIKKPLTTLKWELTGIPCKHVVAAIYNMFENSIGVVDKPPKKRKKSHEEIASQSCSSGKLSRKGRSVKCSKCGNLGHNRKGCKGQGGASQAGGSNQASVRQDAGARNVSSQAAASRNVSSQAAGSSQPNAAPSTSTGARNASSQAAGASQPNATPSTTSQGPRQHSARPTQACQ
ncbi:mutator type transposase [Tanacetum coccineum]